MKRFLTALTIAVSSLLGTIAFDWVGSFQYAEHLFLDYLFVAYQRDYEPNDISLVMIDQKSLISMGSQLNLYWPWPRQIHAIMNDFLTAAGADNIVYDILFDQQDFDRAESVGYESDIALSDAFQNAQNVTIASQIKSFSPKPKLDTYQVDIHATQRKPDLFSSIPIDMFETTAVSVGNAAIPTSYDGVNRYTQYFSFHDSLAIPSLSVAALYSKRTDLPSLITIKDGIVDLGITYPKILENGLSLINWYKKGGVEDGTFPTYSYFALLGEAVKWRRTGTLPDTSLVDFRNKTIFIGASAPGLSDIKATPFSRLEPFPGVEIQATVYANLLHNDHLTKLNLFWKWFILMLGVFTVSFSIYFLSPKYSIFYSLIWFVGILTIGFSLFSEFRIWIPIAELLIIHFACTAINYTTRFVGENKDRRWLKQAFSRYVPKELVNQVIERPENLKLGGEKKELTILFSDLAGFTTISEGMEPEELVPYLNEYLEDMTNIIFKYQGTLDKYIGDAIMAFWGAPLNDENHVENALNCVLDMENHMLKLQEKWHITQKPSTSTRYGINTGEVVVGNVGSSERFNYTVLGDAVNLAARLEPANKNFGTNIMVSEFTRDKVADKFLFRELDRLIVKGKTEPVRVFELLDRKTEETTIKYATFLRLYKDALSLYYEREWIQSLIIFNKLLEKYPNDGPTETYINRIQAFRRNPPPLQWNGVFHLTSK